MYFDAFFKIELPVAFFEARTSFMPYNITQEHRLLKMDIMYCTKYYSVIYSIRSSGCYPPFLLAPAEG